VPREEHDTVLRIAEVYESLQGEGELTGTPSVFVRTTGCNLRCWFCDTPFTSWKPEGDWIEVRDVADRVLALDCRHVVVTGGEPLLQPDVVELCGLLKRDGCFITVETAGTVFRSVAADLMSISPKLRNSTPPAELDSDWSVRHEQQRHRPDVIRELVRQYRCQLKFVIDQPDDVQDVIAWLSEFPEIDRGRVWLMPQAVTADDLADRSAWLAPAAGAAGFQFTSRWHIAQYGNVRGR